MAYDKPLFYHVMSYAAQANRDVVDMVSGNPDWDPPEGIRSGLAEFATFDNDQFNYPPSEGLHQLRDEIAARRGVNRDAVIITNGAGEANYLAMATALQQNAGSEVVLSDPVYPYYPGKTEILQGTVTFVSTHENGQPNLTAIEEAISEETACVVINTPNNPTGAVYPSETMEALYELASGYNAILISDEVYDHFDLSETFSSALALPKSNRIVTNAFSKSMAITGFRVGYVVVPERLVPTAKKLHMLINVTGSRPAQYAVYNALKTTDSTYYAENRSILRTRFNRFMEGLESAGAEFTHPDGALYIMARFPEFPGTLQNVERLIDEAGVAGMPGEVFGSTMEDAIRFTVTTDRIKTASERLIEYFD